MKIRIAVAVSANGDWEPAGPKSAWPPEGAEVTAKRWLEERGESCAVVHVVEADVPVPEAVTVIGVTQS